MEGGRPGAVPAGDEQTTGTWEAPHGGREGREAELGRGRRWDQCSLSAAHSRPPERSEAGGTAEVPYVGAGAGFRIPTSTCHQVSQEEGRASWKPWFLAAEAVPTEG